MPAFIRQVTIRNYKSIAHCRVKLGALTFLLGLNGAGKSNFLDALRFVAEALRTSLDHALRDRGGIGEVRRKSGGHPTHFSLRLDFVLPTGETGHYAFSIGSKTDRGYEVQAEECAIHATEALNPVSHFFRVEAGVLVDSSVKPLPAAFPDRLFLVAASGIPAFRPIFDALSCVEVYNLNPNAISALQRPDPSGVLRRDGSNAASVLHQLSDEALDQISQQLKRIVPGVVSVGGRTLSTMETIEFRQDVKGQANPWKFPASAMSDGTLRALGVLLAVYQASAPPPGVAAPLLIGLEEPESALHPAAAKVLLSALRQGAAHCQLIATSHSPDLLDDPDIDADELLAVDNIDGVTRIGPIDEAGRNALKERLFTPGELLRQNQIAIDKKSLENPDRQYKLFDHGER